MWPDRAVCNRNADARGVYEEVGVWTGARIALHVRNVESVRSVV